ncbi:TonB-dependent receptor [Ancylomarina salipaludis]|uniref:TonB-dependent receptor n=1 Tax=Ancylomarina salipaludis TaxID=2501299 RepID=A0A4Q1JLZ3_9BACT|nr:TonB-dependent receptor [Ancylomarina salipaludis]RXQ94976.1 TonB-dependent receptor [Ancylomarina salipaludis]
MKKAMRSILSMAALMMLSVAAIAQTTVKGVVVDGSTNETLPGASVVIPGTATGTVTGFDGAFVLEVPNGTKTILVSFVGFLDKELTLNGTQDFGTIKLESDAVGLNEVSVMASVAIQRKTPVAVSTISPEIIQEKLGTQEFPEVLKSTPGVYATKQGGGFGDSRINMRGFASENIAVMINGIPVNDMEWGGVYWSNWAGLSDVTRSMQTQRGLGAAKIAAPSVGGSINILTKTTDMKKGGSVFSGIGNDGYKKTAVTLSTGLMDNGYAITFSGSKTEGDGYIMGTPFEGYSYFLNVSKQINEKHQLSFTAFGAPQWHDQRSRYDARKIEEWRDFKDGYKFNATYGFDVNGEYMNVSHNFYHKPQISLNHFWTIDEKTSVSTAVYASISTGGGWSAQGNERSRLYGSDTEYRTIEGYKDYARIQQENSIDPNGSQAIIGVSNNNHQWYGLLSTINKDLTDELNFSGGIDMRYYIGEHTRTVGDLLGGAFFIDPNREDSDVLANDEKLKEGDVIGRDYDGIVLSTGGFAQIEYTTGNLSSFVSGAISNTNYKRRDRFYYDDKTSKAYNYIGGTLKGGANYNINEYHNVFANIGAISRAPYFSNVFTAKDFSNVANEDAVNEKIYSVELGYGYKSSIISANVNAYYTMWNDKAVTGLVDRTDPDAGSYNMTGVNALHKGIEIDIKAKPADGLSIYAMLSIGDWKWQDDTEALIFDRDGKPVDENGNVVEAGSDKQNKVSANIANVSVGDAAQTTAAIGANYKLTKDLKIGVDYNYFARLFSNPTNVTDLAGTNTWEVPDYGVVDANVKYTFAVGPFTAIASAKVMNLFDAEYIADSYATTNKWQDATVFYGFGRTWTASLKFKF